MPLELLFLGTGTSAGVPMIGCRCEVCTSADPRDQRTRPSVIVRYPDPTLKPCDPDGETRTKTIDASGNRVVRPACDAPYRQYLIDTAPEMRVQMIREGIDRLDGVLYTHAHADHVFGLDDLRRFNAVMDGPIDLFAEPETLATLRGMFPYIFESHKNLNQSWVPQLLARPVEPGAVMDLHGARWTPLRLLHGRQPVLGFRVDLPPLEAGNGAPDGGFRGFRGFRGSLAYCTDVSAFPPETLAQLEGLDVLVIDGLRYRHHPTHLTVDQAVEIVDRLRPRRAYLTHIAHDISHAELEPRLPEGVHLSYDGLRVSCENRAASEGIAP